MADFSQLPAVDKILAHSVVKTLCAQYGRTQTLLVVRKTLEEARSQVKSKGVLPDIEALVATVGEVLYARAMPKLRTVFNLTGTVLHTNLGRAVLPEEAVVALVAAARQPCALEYDLHSGNRGDRDHVVRELLIEMTGAEDATVVNNNAAAVFLLLNTLALRKEVLVSRGELIEIGGAFRVPDIMARAGAKLVEVGTTNRTHLKDFAERIAARTVLLMKIHASNYAISGFTCAVPQSELAALAHTHQLPFVVDLGAGTLLDLERYGLPHEPTPREAIAAGADLVSFSGDKLLGGPQAGLIVGRRDLIAKLKKNPMKRALRVGKLTLAALEAVLRLYRDPDSVHQRLVALQQLTRTAADIHAAALRVLPALQSALSNLPVQVDVVTLNSQIGSGALPVSILPSAGIRVRPHGKKGGVLHDIETQLRKLPQPVLGRIEEGALLLDLRCLTQAEEEKFISNLKVLVC